MQTIEHDLESTALATLNEVQQLQVTDAATYEAAGHAMRRIKAEQAKVRSYFRPIIKQAYKSHQEALAQEKRALAPYDDAEALLRPAMVAYLKEAESKRLQQEAALQQDAQLDAAIEAAEAGNDGMAEAIIDGLVPIPPVIIPSQTPKVEGVISRERWAYEIKDASLVPRSYLKIDEAKICNAIRAHRGNLEIPGVAIFLKAEIAVKAEAA